MTNHEFLTNLVRCGNLLHYEHYSFQYQGREGMHSYSMHEGQPKVKNESAEIRYLKEANRKLLLQNQKLLVETEKCSRDLLGAKSKVKR